MTCIVGIAHNGHVYMGGDSAGMDQRYALQIRADRKVFRRGEFVMGFTTSFRMGNLLQHSFEPPRRHPSDDVHKFMCTEFVDAARECLKKGGYAMRENEREEGGTFLVGYAGRLFEVQDDYQVAETVDGFLAIGSGDLVALGALYATASLEPKGRIASALAAAERYSGGVRGPFHIVSTEEAARG